MAAVLWIDVEDLILYARHHARPTGIQRLAFEICQALYARYGGTGLVRFVRHDTANNSFRPVEWIVVATPFRELTESEPPPPVRSSKPDGPGPIRPHSRPRQFVRELVHHLPPSLRAHVIETMQTQEHAFRAWARLASALTRGAARLPGWLACRFTRPPGRAWEGVGEGRAGREFAPTPGDMVLAVAAPWTHPNYPALIARERGRHDLRFALLVYDIIPVRHPEWFPRALVRQFRSFIDNILPLCDRIVAISGATAADVTAYARELGAPLSAPVVSIPIGSGFGVRVPVVSPPRSSRLPPAGSYVLFVSTIEARKNHLLLFRVWRRLLRELPPDRVPVMVFAGRIGWLVDDLMAQIGNSNHLDGKLIVIEDATDTELATLYQGCLFTLFPSFYEGWGLPVTESLAFGKPCLIADRTSLPEAGGDFVRRFDPDNLHDAFATIRDTILDPEGLARWEEHVRQAFRPVSWTESADGLLAALGPSIPPGISLSSVAGRTEPAEGRDGHAS